MTVPWAAAFDTNATTPAIVAILGNDMMEVKSGPWKAIIIPQIGKNIFRLQSMKRILGWWNEWTVEIYKELEENECVGGEYNFIAFQVILICEYQMKRSTFVAPFFTLLLCLSMCWLPFDLWVHQPTDLNKNGPSVTWILGIRREMRRAVWC